MHYVVTVMVEPEYQTEAAIYARVAELMAPYSVHVTVDEYIEECICRFVTGVVDNNCGFCNGTGETPTTANPDGRWNYYCLLSESDLHQEVTAGDVTWAILSPEGGWCEQGWPGDRPGQWTHDELPAHVAAWNEQFRNVYGINIKMGCCAVLLAFNR